MKSEPITRVLKRGAIPVALILTTAIVYSVTRISHVRTSGGRAADALAPYTLTLPGSVVKVQMLPVPAGTIKEGDKTYPVKPFWLASTETTWEAFDVFLASGPPSPPYDQTKYAPDAIARPSKSYILPDMGWGHHGFPAINLSITNVQMFCRWLSKVTGKNYRLPTEAEWDLACRAGQVGEWKLDKGSLDKSAWYSVNSNHVTHPVGVKLPNKLGFYDMLGNVGEWATDMEGKPVLCGGTFRDGQEGMGPETRKYWTPKWQEEDPQLPKSRWWLSNAPFAGFRIACEP